jgi:predicted AAA+ superfamily ATPase
MQKVTRRIKAQIAKDLDKKMVLLAGPRQCGKTTFAKTFLKDRKGHYYNWDILEDKKLIKNAELDREVKLWIFDEIHKYKPWRNWLKGLYDQHHERHQILVTGSAKLDVYRRGGDSLQGRYYFHRLHPFTLSEYLQTKQRLYEEIDLDEISSVKGSQDALMDLLNLSGFPEPLFSGSLDEYNRWQLSYNERLVREDITDLERVYELDKIELLLEQLPKTVGSPLSINSLREDLEINHRTAAHWLDIFERTYASFRIDPFGVPRIKAVKKERKLYMWDWARVEDLGLRFENLMALHLLRLAHYMSDCKGIKTELRFFRDDRKREVDFIMLKKGKPWFAVESKLSAQSLDPNLKYLLERVKIPYAFQVYVNGSTDKQVPDINGCKTFILPASKFLLALP